MLKIIIFDTGWGGELVANYLEDELGIVEVIRVIDWRHAETGYSSLTEAVEAVQTQLHRYIGKVDLIVLGGYVVSLALKPLEELYPEQKFVGMDINYYRITKTRRPLRCVALLMHPSLVDSPLLGEIRRELPESKLIIPDCSSWNRLIDAGEMDINTLRHELEPHFKLMPISKHTATTESEPLSIVNSQEQTWVDTVLLLNTHFFDIKSELEKLFGYSARIMDFRQKLLHDVCLALGLLGVDGCRSK